MSEEGPQTGAAAVGQMTRDATTTGPHGFEEAAVAVTSNQPRLVRTRKAPSLGVSEATKAPSETRWTVTVSPPAVYGVEVLSDWGHVPVHVVSWTVPTLP